MKVLIQTFVAENVVFSHSNAEDVQSVRLAREARRLEAVIKSASDP